MLAVAYLSLVLLPVTPAPAAGGAPTRNVRCDLDGDGIGEVVLGQPSATNGGAAAAGQVLVVPGGRGGPVLARSWVIDQRHPGLGALGGSEAGDGFGATVVCVERAGGADLLAVGVPGEDGPRPDTGAVAVVGAGPRSALVYSAATVDGLAADEDGGRLGAALAAGDLDGDGEDDVVAGAPSASTAGRVIVVPSGDGESPYVLAPERSTRALRFGTAVAVADLDGDGTGEVVVGLPGDGTGAVVAVAADGAERQRWRPARPGAGGFGSVLAAGDLDGDDRDEVAVGAPLADAEGLADVGEVTVVGAGGQRALVLRAGDGLPRELRAPSALLGAALATADTDANGRVELVVGVPGAAAAMGAVAVLDERGLAEVVRQGEQFGGQPEPGDNFGAAVGVANSDGRRGDDLVLAAPGESVADLPGVGVAWVRPGGGAALATPLHALLTGTPAHPGAGSGMTAAASAATVLVASGARAPAPPPDAAAPAPTPTPSTVPTPASVLPAGAVAVGVGDSIMLGATRSLQWYQPGLSVDAEVGRPVEIGLTRVAAAAATRPQVLIVHLGTNGGMTQTQADALAALTAGVPRVVLVTIRVPQPHQDSTNAVLRAAAGASTNMVLADWHGASEGRVEWFWADGIHLTPAGVAAYAALVATVAGFDPPAAAGR